jgi:hypothetical protein
MLAALACMTAFCAPAINATGHYVIRDPSGGEWKLRITQIDAHLVAFGERQGQVITGRGTVSSNEIVILFGDDTARLTLARGKLQGLVFEEQVEGWLETDRPVERVQKSDDSLLSDDDEELALRALEQQATRS